MAKYDHGGGCACGLQAFCDCSHATAEDLRKAKEFAAEKAEREKQQKMKPKDFTTDRRTRNFNFTQMEEAIEFMTGVNGSMRKAGTVYEVSFYEADNVNARYLGTKWRSGMPFKLARPRGVVLTITQEEITLLTRSLSVNYKDEEVLNGLIHRLQLSYDKAEKGGCTCNEH